MKSPQAYNNYTPAIMSSAVSDELVNVLLFYFIMKK